jgi:hypothetical protein
MSAFGGEAQIFCSLSALPVVTDAVEKVSAKKLIGGSAFCCRTVYAHISPGVNSMRSLPVWNSMSSQRICTSSLAQRMAVGQQDRGCIAMAPAVATGGVHQPLDLVLGEVLARSTRSDCYTF